ncbi:imidazole glycerol phosphate synthase subunit HisH [Verrucomicrobiota bacterium]
MVTIVDYGAGNLTSVRLAFDALDTETQITNVPAAILQADRVVFPGVGAAGAAMKKLAELDLIEVLKTVIEQGKPFLGICLGTQIIFERSEEDAGVNGIGLVPGTVKLFDRSDSLVKVPHMGWNNVELIRRHPVFEGIESGSEFYFVHSYYPVPSERNDLLGETEYAQVRFASAIGKENIIATQFHPERSGRIGLKLLENFTRWNGSC